MWEEFEKLEVFEGSMSDSSAFALDSRAGAFLCKSSDCSPFFLIRMGKLTSRTAFRLRYVTFQFDVSYSLRVGGVRATDQCVKVCCEDHEVFRQKIFVQSISSVLSEYSESDPMFLIDALIDLFRSPPLSERKSVTGLWGELLFIISFQDCDEAVMAWHADWSQTRDFVFPNKAIEVKTSSSGERKHFFSLTQLSSAQENDWLCSVMVERTDIGANIMDMAFKVTERCGTEARAIFWSKFLRIVDDFSSEQEVLRYEFDRALKSVRFYQISSLNLPIIGSGGLGVVSDLSFSLTL